MNHPRTHVTKSSSVTQNQANQSFIIAVVIQAFLFARHLMPMLSILIFLKHRGALALPITHILGRSVPSPFARIARDIRAFSFFVPESCSVDSEISGTIFQ
jgi:hypothetical protein